jgi:hypothetical protein
MTERNWKGLGYLQYQLLDWMDKYPFDQVFSIPKEWRRVALSLEKRNIIKIVNKCWTNWTIRRV